MRRFLVCFSFVVRKVRAKAVQKINGGPTRKRWVGERGREEKKQRLFPGFFPWPFPHRFLVRPQGRYSGFFKGLGWSNGPKNSKISPQKMRCRTSEPWQVWMYFFLAELRGLDTRTVTRIFILFWIPSPTPQKSRTWIRRPKIYSPNFSTPKISLKRKFQTQKNPSIIPVTWNSKCPSRSVRPLPLITNHEQKTHAYLEKDSAWIGWDLL